MDRRTLVSGQGFGYCEFPPGLWGDREQSRWGMVPESGPQDGVSGESVVDPLWERPTLRDTGRLNSPTSVCVGGRGGSYPRDPLLWKL